MRERRQVGESIHYLNKHIPPFLNSKVIQSLVLSKPFLPQGVSTFSVIILAFILLLTDLTPYPKRPGRSKK